MNFLMVLIITSVTGITFLLTSLYLCYKNRKCNFCCGWQMMLIHNNLIEIPMHMHLIGRDNRIRKETEENRENSEAAQRERYYATIHKVAHQANDKIPETSEDISPYATFQLSEASAIEMLVFRRLLSIFHICDSPMNIPNKHKSIATYLIHNAQVKEMADKIP